MIIAQFLVLVPVAVMFFGMAAVGIITRRTQTRAQNITGLVAALWLVACLGLMLVDLYKWSMIGLCIACPLVLGWAMSVRGGEIAAKYNQRHDEWLAMRRAK